MINETTPTLKCLVWDLDNTLWHGTLSEGDDVEVAPEIRTVIELLDDRGILQSIASKNDPAEAGARLEQLGLAGYFVLPKIGWGPKSASIEELSDQLNFAAESIAFVDDQPAERAEVAYHLPQVRCYPAEAARSLPSLAEFSPVTVTADSRHRREMYQAAFERDAARADFRGLDEDFVRSLSIQVQMSRADRDSIARVEELTLRTSQMNATGIHYSESRLREYAADPSHEVLVAVMSDRFGQYGAIGVVLLERYPMAWNLKLLATSCRVVSYGIGGQIIAWLANQAAQAGVHLVADFRATDRNRMIDIAYRFAGFTDDPCECHDLVSNPPLQRLHLVPALARRPSAVHIDGIDLQPIASEPA